jgi:hypothetical protein
VFGKRPVIAGFNDSIFSPGEWDAAEGIAVAGVAIGKYGDNTYAFNTYRDGNDEINNSPSINDRSQTTEVRRQKSDDRQQKTEVRRQMTDDRILRPFGWGPKSKASYY